MGCNGKKLLSLTLALTLGLTACGQPSDQTSEGEQQKEAVFQRKESLELWYTDDTLTEYLNSVAVAYGEEKDVRITPVLKPGKEFVEQIYSASMESKDGASDGMPDLYLVTNDVLEQVTLTGLTDPVSPETLTAGGIFPKSALDAVTYHGAYVAYPVFFDTSVLLYNKTYLADHAAANLPVDEELTAGGEVSDGEGEGEEDAEVVTSDENPADSGEGMGDAQSAVTETLAEETAAPLTEEEIQERIEGFLPATIGEIETFADSYDAPEGLDTIFEWDVADILYNYDFVGGNLVVGGDTGDQPDNISIYNEDTIRCLEIFQELNQFFFIDVDTISYEKVLQDFADGKTLFTVAGTDAVGYLESLKEEGDFTSEYGAAMMPDLTEDLSSRSLSITTTLVVNGMSAKKEAAHQFASSLVTTGVQDLYARAGKVPSNLTVSLPYEALEVYRQEYAESISMPKMMSTSNLWMKLEVGFTRIWNGEDAGQILQEIAQEVDEQVAP